MATVLQNRMRFFPYLTALMCLAMAIAVVVANYGWTSQDAAICGCVAVIVFIGTACAFYARGYADCESETGDVFDDCPDAPTRRYSESVTIMDSAGHSKTIPVRRHS